MEEQEFRTIKGYQRSSGRELTEAMEDYLEMICRFAREDGKVRINHLAAWLHVKPSSASKMVRHLRELGYVNFERYGVATPTDKGWEAGNYLLHRHEVLEEFLRLLNGTADELTQAEQVEHFFDEKTICNLERLVERMKRETEKEAAGNGGR